MTTSSGYRLFCIILGIFLLTTSVAAVSGYSVSGSQDIETPTRTASYEGQDYTLDSVTRITADDSVMASTTVPDGASYSLQLRDPDNGLISNQRLTGDATYEFSYFGSGEAGTYATVIEDGGDIVAVHPVVMKGYDVSISQPADVTAGEDAEISATVSELSVDKHSSLKDVQVVVGNDDVKVQQSLTQSGGDTYETSIDTSGLDADAYNVYVVVRGDETVQGRDELLGISDTVQLTVEEDSSSTDGNDTDSSTGGPAGSETGTATEATSVNKTDTPSTTATDAPTEAATDAPTETASEFDNVLQPTTSTEASTTSTEAPTTLTGPSTTSTNGPGFTVLAGVVALILGIGIASRR